MKKALRYLLIIVLVLIVAAGAFAAYVAIRGIPKYKAETVNLKVEATPARLVQGQKLATLLCANCHMDPKTGRLTGNQMKEAPQFGEIYSRNITQHPLYGIGKWTDGQIAYLIRTGIKPDGTYLPPYMPKLVNLSDEDLYSIIAFLRSDHPWVQPHEAHQPPTKPSFLTKFLTTAGIIKPFPYPQQSIPQPDTTDKIKWGRYIAVAQLECFSCHSKDFVKNDYFHPENSLGFFGGGNEMISPVNGQKIKSSNITADEETGIGRWSEEGFVKAVRFGQAPDGRRLRLPMMPYGNLTDNELRAVYAYLKTVPKIHNKVEP